MPYVDKNIPIIDFSRPFIGITVRSTNPFVEPSGQSRDRNRRHRIQGGFTMVELLVTIAVAVVLFSIAAPSFQGVMTQTRLSESTNEIVSLAALARSTAVTERFSVIACPTNDQINCDAGQSWGVGWMLFVDCNGNGVLDNGPNLCGTAQPERILREGSVSSGASQEISGILQYQPSGRVVAARTFNVCVDPLTDGKDVLVSATGRTRVVGNAGGC